MELLTDDLKDVMELHGWFRQDVDTGSNVAGCGI